MPITFGLSRNLGTSTRIEDEYNGQPVFIMRPHTVSGSRTAMEFNNQAVELLGITNASNKVAFAFDETTSDMYVALVPDSHPDRTTVRNIARRGSYAKISHGRYFNRLHKVGGTETDQEIVYRLEQGPELEGIQLYKLVRYQQGELPQDNPPQDNPPTEQETAPDVDTHSSPFGYAD